MPQFVQQRIVDFNTSTYSNIHRGAHFLGDGATDAYENARKKVARFVGAQSPREIIFTKNATEGINLVAHSLGEQEGVFNEGDAIIVSRMEHHANLVPWLQLRKRKNLQLRFIELTKEKELDLASLKDQLDETVKLVAVPHVSNVLGTQVAVDEVCKMAKQNGALTLIDGCQAVAHHTVDVERIDCDFYVYSGHKMYGPSGIGVVYGKKEVLKQMPPFLGGGEMIREVRFNGFEPAEIPHRFEAGTPPISQAVGLGFATEWLSKLGLKDVEQHDKELSQTARELLLKIPEVEVVSHEQASGLVTFVAEGVQSYDIADYLSDNGICVRVGLHCAEPLHDYLGLKTTVRASFGVYNTKEEVKRFAEVLQKGIQEL